MIYAQHYWFRGQKIIVMQDLTQIIIFLHCKVGTKRKKLLQKSAAILETIQEFRRETFQFKTTFYGNPAYNHALPCTSSVSQRWDFESFYAVVFNLRSFDLSWNL